MIFIAFTVLFLILMMYLCENSFVTGLLVIGIWLGASMTFYQDVWTRLSENPSVVVEYVLAYIILGVCWGVAKWWLYVKKAKSTYQKTRDRLAEDHSTEDLAKIVRIQYAHQIPDLAIASQKVPIWMAYWPFSLLRMIFFNLLIDFWNFLYRQIKGIFSAIIKYHFKEFPEFHK